MAAENAIWSDDLEAKSRKSCLTSPLAAYDVIDDVWITDAEAGVKFSVTRVTIWRWLKADRSFPRPVKLSPGCTRFRLRDLDAWADAKRRGEAA